MEQSDIIQLIRQEIDAYSRGSQFSVAKVPDHVHNGTDSNRVDYKNIVNISAVSVPTPPGNATQFLNGASTPAFAQVKDSDLDIQDNTAGNAATDRHGFLRKLSNVATEFMNGAGNWATPAAASPTWNNGYVAYDTSTASGTQNIAHGLGRVPVFVKISMTWENRATAPGEHSFSIGTYNGTTNKGIYHYDRNYNGSSYTNGGGYMANIVLFAYSAAAENRNASAVATVDATNIILTWTKVGSCTGTISLAWEAT